jgi:hypothetical protein
MEIILSVMLIVLIGYLFWQSYLLSQYKKIVDDQQDTINKLKPF